MARRLGKKTGGNLLVMALAAIFISGGVLVACSRAQTSIATPTRTTTSASSATTTSAAATTTTSAPATTTTSAPAPTTTSAPAATTVSAADFYKANVVTIIVPYGPGGSADYAARLFANYWTEVTGGRMIVENKAGGSGFLGTNYAYAAKPDGITLGVGFPRIGSDLADAGARPGCQVRYQEDELDTIHQPGNICTRYQCEIAVYVHGRPLAGKGVEILL